MMMKKLLMMSVGTSLVALGAALAAPAGPATVDAPAALAAADRFRLGDEFLQVETAIRVHHADGTLDKERAYTVFAQGPRKSLVLMRSPAEQGQKVLVLGDDFWLVLPGSKRPMRITPLQKLLGDASTGDIALMNWAGDYRVTEQAPPECPTQRPCRRLQLLADRKGLSYQRIELWLGERHLEPLRAELYVQSDKLAKVAEFVMDRPEAPRQVAEMVLTDRLGSGKVTRVRYLARVQRQVPESWLNPMFLARQGSLE